MRNLAATVAVLAALGAGGAAAQRAADRDGATTGKAAAAAEMPGKESAPAQITGPGEAAAPRRPAGAEAGLRTVAIVPGADPGALLELARARGEARLMADGYGDPLIEATAGGRLYDITFFDCTDNAACRSIMLRAAFRGTGQGAAEMVGWNRTQRFGKAYLDEAGNPVLEMNVNLAGGVTRANLAATFALWLGAMDAFAGQVGY